MSGSLPCANGCEFHGHGTAPEPLANDIDWSRGAADDPQRITYLKYDNLDRVVVTTEHPGFTQRNTRLRLSWTDAVADWPANTTDINDLENVVRTFYSYDPHGSATTVINDIPVTSDPETDRLITRTDYTYDLSTGNVTAVDFQKDEPRTASSIATPMMPQDA